MGKLSLYILQLALVALVLPHNLFAANLVEKDIKEAFVNREWDKVIEIAYNWREEAKTTPIPYLLLTYAYYSKGDYQKIPFFLEFIATQDKKESLLAWAEEFSREYPQDPLAHLLKADVYVRLKKYDEAIKEFDAAQELDPKHSLVYAIKGMNYAFSNTNDLAIKNFNEAIKLEPSSADIYNNRGIVYYCQGDYAQSLADFNQAIKINPDFTLAYLGRARVYYCLEKNDLALADLKRVKEINEEGFSLSSQTIRNPLTGKTMHRFSINLQTNPSRFNAKVPLVRKPVISGSFGSLKGIDSKPEGQIRKLREGVLINEEKLDDKLIVPASSFLLYNDQFLLKTDRGGRG